MDVGSTLRGKVLGLIGLGLVLLAWPALGAESPESRTPPAQEEVVTAPEAPVITTLLPEAACEE